MQDKKFIDIERSMGELGRAASAAAIRLGGFWALAKKNRKRVQASESTLLHGNARRP